MQKIVHIISSLHTGGAEMMLYRLLRAMDRTRFSPVVIALMRGGSTLEGEIAALGVPIHYAEMRQGRPSLSALLRIAKVLRREKPDVVQGWMVHANLAAQLACRFASSRPRVFWAVHNSLESLHREKWLTALLIWISARLSKSRGERAMPERIVYVSRISREQHERIGFDTSRGVMIPNGIDTDVFAPSEACRTSVRSELGLPVDALLIGMMGRFHPQKNHTGFLYAAKRVLERHPEAKIVFAGTGMEAENEKLVSLLRDTGFGSPHKSIHLLGERRDMPRLTAALDIAVSASAYGEALSLAVAEAMASAVPCVVTDVGDNGLLVDKAGIVVAPNDLEAMAEGCRTLICLGRDGRMALGAMAREQILKNYALPAVVRRYEELYSSNLNSPLRRS